MRTAHLLAIAILGLAAPAMAETAAPAQPSDAIFQVEAEFDAFTHQHGYTKGFFTYSAPDAIAFDGNGAVRIHERLAARLAEDSSEKDAPSKLRWRPYLVGMASTEDLAYDLGPWTIEGTDKAGWFFTIWQKQPDGQWRWVLDTGAGPSPADRLPAPGSRETRRVGGPAPTPTALEEVDGPDDALNAALKMRPAMEAYKAADLDYIAVASDDAPPALDRAAAVTALATRPQGLTWSQDGKAIAKDGRFAYTYGHANGSDGAYKGHYVRVWIKMGPKPTDWALDIDLYQAAK